MGLGTRSRNGKLEGLADQGHVSAQSGQDRRLIGRQNCDADVPRGAGVVGGIGGDKLQSVLPGLAIGGRPRKCLR